MKKRVKSLLIVIALSSCGYQQQKSPSLKQVAFNVTSIDLFTTLTTEDIPYAAINLTVTNASDAPFYYINGNSLLFKTPYKSKFVLVDSTRALSYPLFSTLKQEEIQVNKGDEKKFYLILDSVFFKKRIKKGEFNDSLYQNIQSAIKQCEIYYYRDKSDHKYGVSNDTVYKIKIGNAPFNFR